MLTDWWAALLDLLFPQRCPACRQWTEGSPWCPTCLAQLARPSQVSLILHKLTWLDECLTVTDYTGAVRGLIRDMKFRCLTRQAPKLGQLLAYALPPDRYIEADMIVPVPLHADRLKERGFNQTALIFSAWADKQKLIWADVLTRTRPTAPQWELNLKERRANIKGAFKVTRPELVAGKHILLVDDIFTTGLTMNECARILKQAGALTVKGLALASGDR